MGTRGIGLLVGLLASALALAQGRALLPGQVLWEPAAAKAADGAATEALAQADAIIPYFQGVLSFNARSHPATTYLITAASVIAAFQANYFKAIFNRARPSRLLPGLLPPLRAAGCAGARRGRTGRGRSRRGIRRGAST